MEKREDPDEMLHKAAFHQDLYYLLRQNRSSEKEIIFLESITSITPHYIQCEPRHEISNNVVFATSKASDQPAHTRSLIKAFACPLNSL